MKDDWLWLHSSGPKYIKCMGLMNEPSSIRVISNREQINPPLAKILLTKVMTDSAILKQELCGFFQAEAFSQQKGFIHSNGLSVLNGCACRLGNRGKKWGQGGCWMADFFKNHQIPHLYI